MSAIKGKDIIDDSIGLNKLSIDVKESLIRHSSVKNLDLSEPGSSGSVEFDGIILQATNQDGTFFYLTFYSETPIVVDIIRTVFTTSGSTGSSQRTDGATIDQSGLQLTPITTGATIKAQVEIITSDAIYNGWLGSNVDLTRCWGYVEKI